MWGLINAAANLKLDILLDLVVDNDQFERNIIEQMQFQVRYDKDNVLQFTKETNAFANRFENFLSNSLDNISIAEFDKLGFKFYLFSFWHQLSESKNPKVAFYSKPKKTNIYPKDGWTWWFLLTWKSVNKVIVFKWWKTEYVNQLLSRRNYKGEFQMLFQRLWNQLKIFFGYFRMRPATLEYILC